MYCMLEDGTLPSQKIIFELVLWLFLQLSGSFWVMCFVIQLVEFRVMDSLHTFFAVMSSSLMLYGIWFKM